MSLIITTITNKVFASSKIIEALREEEEECKSEYKSRPEFSAKPKIMTLK